MFKIESEGQIVHIPYGLIGKIIIDEGRDGYPTVLIEGHSFLVDNETTEALLRRILDYLIGGRSIPPPNGDGGPPAPEAYTTDWTR